MKSFAEIGSRISARELKLYLFENSVSHFFGRWETSFQSYERREMGSGCTGIRLSKNGPVSRKHLLGQARKSLCYSLVKRFVILDIPCEHARCFIALCLGFCHPTCRVSE